MLTTALRRLVFKPCQKTLLVSRIRCIQARSLASTSRASSASSTSRKTSSHKTAFPERLLVYHAGTGRTVFLGCLKVTTIFIFTFFVFVIAPLHFKAENEPLWVGPSVVLFGIIPICFVGYVSGPFVTYIHLRLPAFARQSKEVLLRYTKTLPKDAELDVTTMNFIGKPRVARVRVQDLRPVRERFGQANFARDTREINKKRPWWMGKAVSQFGVHSDTKRILGGEVWDNITHTIAKNSR